MYCMLNLSGKYQVKDMNAYIELLINELLELLKGITMFDIYRLVGAQMEFYFHAIIIWTIHNALGLTHFYGML